MYNYQKQDLKRLLMVKELPPEVQSLSAEEAAEMIREIQNKRQKQKDEEPPNNLESSGLFDRWNED